VLLLLQLLLLLLRTGLSAAVSAACIGLAARLQHNQQQPHQQQQQQPDPNNCAPSARLTASLSVQVASVCSMLLRHHDPRCSDSVYAELHRAATCLMLKILSTAHAPGSEAATLGVKTAHDLYRMLLIRSQMMPVQIRLPMPSPQHQSGHDALHDTNSSTQQRTAAQAANAGSSTSSSQCISSDIQLLHFEGALGLRVLELALLGCHLKVAALLSGSGSSSSSSSSSSGIGNIDSSSSQLLEALGLGATEARLLSKLNSCTQGWNALNLDSLAADYLKCCKSLAAATADYGTHLKSAAISSTTSSSACSSQAASGLPPWLVPMLSTAVQIAVDWPGGRQVAMLLACVELCAAWIKAVVDTVPALAAGPSEPVAERSAPSAAAQSNTADIEGRNQAQKFMLALARPMLHKLGGAVVEAVRSQQQQQQLAGVQTLPQEARQLLQSYSLLILLEPFADGECG
jgi:hypothetical protein